MLLKCLFVRLQTTHSEQKNPNLLDIQCDGPEEKTHGFNTISSAAFKMLSEKW